MAERASSHHHHEPVITAHELLAPAVAELCATIREADARVAATAGGQARGGAGYDAEAIHDLRVGLRRLRTLLRPARSIYGKRKIRAASDELRRFAQATGIVRDEEVLHETLASLDLPRRTRRALDAWIRSRARRERKLRATAVELLTTHEESLGRPSLDHALTALESCIRSRKQGKQAASEVARSAIDAAIEGVREAATLAPSTADAAAMHALRIREKRLRYTAEIFAEVLPGESARLAKDAAKMQKRLGELHDFDQAIAVVLQARSLSRPARPLVIEALREARARLAARLVDDVAAAAHAPGVQGDAPSRRAKAARDDAERR
jgi:CHAD domain-containing protein